MTCLVTIFLSTNKYFDILMEFVRCSTQNKSFHFIGMRDFVRKISSRSKGHHHHVDELVDYASVYVIIRQTEKIVIYSKLHRMMTTSSAECKKDTASDVAHIQNRGNRIKLSHHHWWWTNIMIFFVVAHAWILIA